MSELSRLQAKIGNPGLISIGEAMGGAFGGAFALTVLFPLDTVKIRATTNIGKKYTYKTMLSDLIHLRNVTDLYRGFKIGLLETMMFHGVFFFFYSLARNDWIHKNYPNTKNHINIPLPPKQAIIRGALSGLATQLLTTPFGIMKTKLQTSSPNENSTDVIISVYEDDGITGYWRGFKTSILLIVNPIIVNFVYERLSNFFRNKFGDTFWISFVSGFLSKSVASILCQPLNFIKANLQAAQKRSSQLSRMNYKSFQSKKTTIPLKKSIENGFENGFENGYENENDDENDEFDDEFNDEFDDEYRDKNKMLMNLNGNTSVKKQLFTPISRNDSFERTASMSALFNHTMKNEGLIGLYSGLGPKLLHAALTYALIFSCKAKFTKYTFLMILYLSGKNNGKSQMQKS